MELGSERFKSRVGVIRGVGVEAVGVGVGRVWVEGSGWDRGGRKVGVRSWGWEGGRELGVGVGEIGVRKVGIRGVGVRGDLGSKESRSGGLMTFPTSLTPTSPISTSLIPISPIITFLTPIPPTSVPSKLCACARAHGFQRLRTLIHILRTDIL